MQIEYSLLERTVERELIPVAKDQGITIVGWSPLCSGMLTGKYLPESGEDAADARLNNAMLKGFVSVDDHRLAIVREVVSLAREMGVSPAQVALAWLRHRPVRVIPIIGARNLTQLQDNFGSLEVTFSQDQLARLEQISAPDLGYPQDLLGRDMVRALAFGGMRDRIAD
jgi:aryl-alcohol dehydrogenase-like predicted oxidoreductase